MEVNKPVLIKQLNNKRKLISCTHFIHGRMLCLRMMPLL